MRLIDQFSEEYIKRIKDIKSEMFFEKFSFYVSGIEKYLEPEQYQDIALDIERAVQIVPKGNILLYHDFQVLTHIEKEEFSKEIIEDITGWSIFEENYCECNLYILCISTIEFEFLDEEIEAMIAVLEQMVMLRGYKRPWVLIINDSEGTLEENSYELFCFR